MLMVMALVSFLASLVPLGAQGTRGLPVTVRIFPNGVSAEPSLETVLGGAIELALKKADYIVIQTGPESGVDVEFGLEAGYVLNGNRVGLNFSITDAKGMMQTETLVVEYTLDPQFDQSVGNSVQSLMVAVEREHSIHPRTLVVNPETPAATTTAASAPRTTPVPESGQAVPAASGKDATPRHLGAGSGGFVPMGRAAGYFTAAFQFQADFDFPLGSSKRWRAGVQAGVVTFSIEDANQAGAGTTFATLGGETAYTIASWGIFSPYLAAASGVSLAFIQGAGSSSYIEPMPFGTAGLGTRIRIAGRFALKFEAVSMAILDIGTGSIDLVWGIVPRLAATVEL
jgi:hypothetical protein